MLTRAKVLRILTGLLVAASITFSVVMHIQNKDLKRLIANQGTTLSPDVRRLLVSDLESGDPQRIKARGGPIISVICYSRSTRRITL